jgi:hypothetical protein
MIGRNSIRADIGLSFLLAALEAPFWYRHAIAMIVTEGS